MWKIKVRFMSFKCNTQTQTVNILRQTTAPSLALTVSSTKEMQHVEHVQPLSCSCLFS